MYKPESILENKIHKTFYDFYTQIDHLIQEDLTKL